MKKLYSLIVLLVVLLFGACSDPKHVTEPLHRAEALMNEHPDSALNLLKGIAQTELQTQAHHARYALLYSQALDKNYIDLTNDSLINIAVDYYKDRDDVRAKFFSFYYLGRIYTNANNPTQATLAYIEAEQLVDELGDDYAAGLLYKQIGLVYYSYYDFSKSLQAHQQAIEHFTKAGKPIHKIQAQLTLSSVYRSLNEEENSYKVLQNALMESHNLNNQGLVKSCICNLIVACIDLEKWEEATQWYQEYQKNNGRDYPSIAFYGYIARLHAKNRNFKDAFMLLDEIKKKTENLQDSINLYYAESQVHQMNGSWEEAYRSMNKSVSHQNRIVRKSLQQPVLTTQNNYLNQELEFKAYKLRIEKTLRTVSISLISFIAVVTVFLIWKKLRKDYLNKLKKLEIENGLQIEKIQLEAEEREQSLQSIVRLLEHKLKEEKYLSSQNMDKLRTELEATQHHIKESQKVQQEMANYIKELCQQKQTLKDELENRTVIIRELEQENRTTHISNNLKSKLLKRYFTLMEDMITLSSRKFKKDEDKHEALSKQYKEAINNFSGNKSTDTKLEKMVNECNDDIMKHLREEINLPDHTYYQLACYLLAGYSVNVIACALGETTNTIYKRRDKIRSIIMESEANHKDLFLQI
ncbi:MAG: hypothetical protein IKW32_08605 [Bacteroidaceae bacterium]|nr:hypothetical protein [Bacteroidaceae bacterium]